jgi:hypothetical protein
MLSLSAMSVGGLFSEYRPMDHDETWKERSFAMLEWNAYRPTTFAVLSLLTGRRSSYVGTLSRLGGFYQTKDTFQN